MPEENEIRNRRLAIVMLILGLVGQSAYAIVVYDAAVGGQHHALVPGLAWLRYVVWAGWALLLVRAGLMRVLIGCGAIVVVVLFVYASETVPLTLATRAPATAEARNSVYVGVGDVFTIPSHIDVDANVFSLDGYHDRPILLSFWRSWCSPCIAEIPILNDIDGLVTDRGPLAVIGINDEPAELQKSTRDRIGIRFRLLVEDEVEDDSVVRQFPTNVVLWRGKVVTSWAGARHDLREHVLRSLRRESPGG